MRRALILTALPVEFEAVRAHLRGVTSERHRKGTQYESGTYGSGNSKWEVGIAQVGAGNAGAAAEAERALDFFAPRVAMFVGVAGGLKSVSLGDVIAADQVYGYHSGKGARTFRPRPNVGRSTYPLVQLANVIARDWNRTHKVHGGRAKVGNIAAGEELIAATRSQTFRFLRAQYEDALAVEMEGRGFLTAIGMTPGVDALVVRGISDLIDGKARSDASGSQERAAANAAEFAFLVLRRFAQENFASAPRHSTGGDQRASRQRKRATEMHGGSGSHPTLQVFVCSRMGAGLDRERAVVAKAIDEFLLARPWLWERDGCGGRSVEELCTSAARASDLLVLLVGADTSAIVEAEFRAALDASVTCAVFTKKSSPPNAQCRHFLAKLAKRAILPRNFQNPSELKTHIVGTLHALIVDAVRESGRRRRIA